MRTLLLQPPHVYYDRKRQPCFPIGLGYIAAVLRQKDYVVDVLDLNATEKSDEELGAYLEEKSFDVIGITAMSVQFNAVERIVRIIRERSTESRIVLGGALAIHSYPVVLAHLDIDYCALGEGETILLSLLKNLDRPEQVKGLAFRRDGSIVLTPPQEYITDLDSLPFPAWDLFPMDIYIKNNSDSVTLITGRGCPFNCHFCSKNFKGVRQRSIPNIIKEIKAMKELYKVKHFGFSDELVVTNERRITELCGELKKLDITWGCQGRINYATTQVLSTMKEAGCILVGFGVESGSQRILKNMNKGITPDMIAKAIRTADSVGIDYYPQLIFGYVGENEETLKETERLCFKAGMSPPFNVATPYPGTMLYEWAKAQGKIGDDLEYLRHLQGNSELYINCSTFPDDKVLAVKHRFEKRIMRNYLLYSFLHPRRLIKDNRKKAKFLAHHIRMHGVGNTAREFIRAVKKYPQAVFGRF
jgi:anaerobic magnesium-protoporphyrin IX monomethyl ester cyclase